MPPGGGRASPFLPAGNGCSRGSGESRAGLAPRSSAHSPPSRRAWWIVRQEAHGREAEIDKDLGSDTVVPRIGREAELKVGFDGVQARVLQCVRFQLVAQPD